MRKIVQNRMWVIITALALVYGALIPFFALYDLSGAQAAAASNTAADESGFFSGKVLICTSDGYQWTSWEALQKQTPRGHQAAGTNIPGPGGTDSPPSIYKCPLCYLSAHSPKALAPAAHSVPAPRGVTVAAPRATLYDNIVKPCFIYSAYRNRAPPRPA